MTRTDRAFLLVINKLFHLGVADTRILRPGVDNLERSRERITAKRPEVLGLVRAGHDRVDGQRDERPKRETNQVPKHSTHYTRLDFSCGRSS